MARIKVEDLPQDMKVSKEEMKKVFGGRDEHPPPVMLGKHPRGGYLIVHQSMPTGDDLEGEMFFEPNEMKS